MNKIVNPANGITLFRFLLIPLLIYFLLNQQTGISLLIFVVFTALDAFDGFVARKWNCGTIFGRNFDLLVDSLMFVPVYLILFVNDKIPPLYVILLLISGGSIVLCVCWGVYLQKNTFIPSTWKILDGISVNLGLFFLLWQTQLALTLAYISLTGLYLGAGRYVWEMYHHSKSS